MPEWLDWDIWQGPATRVPFHDNYVHYNWHWFWHWGTGEALNNGTHMVDILRWGMEEDYPVSVNSVGGRFRYQDDWETPDTQVISMNFADGKSMTWRAAVATAVRSRVPKWVRCSTAKKAVCCYRQQWLYDLRPEKQFG